MIAEKGGIEEKEMYNVFNMGVGFVMALDAKDVDTVLSLLKSINEEAYVIGEVTDNEGVNLIW